MCIDGSGSRRIFQDPDRNDLAAANSDISRIPGRPGSVDNVTVDNHEIEGGRLRRCPKINRKQRP